MPGAASLTGSVKGAGCRTFTAVVKSTGFPRITQPGPGGYDYFYVVAVLQCVPQDDVVFDQWLAGVKTGVGWGIESAAAPAANGGWPLANGLPLVGMVRCLTLHCEAWL